jgi:hypothetical protein
VPGTVRLQERITVMMHGGVSLEQVEEEVIEQSDLNPDQKAALWLYAWSFMRGTEQRTQATRYLMESGH